MKVMESPPGLRTVNAGTGIQAPRVGGWEMKSMDDNSRSADIHAAREGDEEDRIEAIENLADKLGMDLPDWMFDYEATEETLMQEATRRIYGVGG
jgi:hypothetical protein